MCGCDKPNAVGTQEVTSKQEPWAPMQPYLMNVAGAANQLFNGPQAQYFPGSTVAPFSPHQEMGMDLITGRALQGSPLLEGAQAGNMATMGGAYLNSPASGFLSGQMGADPTVNPYTSLMGSTASGGFLNGNPWLDQQYDRAASAVTRNYRDAVKPGIDSQFINSGMYGSELWQNAQDSARDQLGRSLEGMAGSMYGQNYQQERDRMMGAASGIQGAFDSSLNRGLNAAGLSNSAFANERNNMMTAMGMAPGLAQADYADFDRLMGVGNQVQQQAQGNIMDQVGRWNHYQNQPEQTLNNYAGIIGNLGGMGGTGTQSQPLYGNSTGQNLLGAGMAGMGLLSGIPGAAAGAKTLGSCC